MGRKIKTVFIISIILNIILLSVIIWGYSKANVATDELFSHDVSHQLVKLEGAIATQEEEGWNNPDQVASQLQVAKQGLWSSFNTAKNLHSVSEEDKQVLNRLYILLHHGYSTDVADVSDDDLAHLSELRLALRDAGFGMSIQIGGDKKTFMENAEKLLKNLEERRLEKTEG